jgi:hypothetical protein
MERLVLDMIKINGQIFSQIDNYYLWILTSVAEFK